MQISTHALSFGYPGKPLFSNVNITFSPGRIHWIAGPNGSGKSTLVKSVLGLKETASGHLHFGDGLKSKDIGYLPQQTTAQKDFPASVYEVVLSGCIGEKKIFSF